MPRYIATRRSDTTADLTWGDHAESVTVRLRADGGLDTNGILDWSEITDDDGAAFAEWLKGESEEDHAWTMLFDIEEIARLLANCIVSARENGYEGDDEDYTYTTEDLDSIVVALDRKPYRDEWIAAGLPMARAHIGNRHIGDGA